MTNEQELEELKELARHLGFEAEDFGDDDATLHAGDDLCAGNGIGDYLIIEEGKVAELRRFLLLPEMDFLRQRLRRRKRAWLALRDCVRRNMISHGMDGVNDDDCLGDGTDQIVLRFSKDEIEQDGDNIVTAMRKRPKHADEDVARWACEYNSLTKLIDDQIKRMASQALCPEGPDPDARIVMRWSAAPLA